MADKKDKYKGWNIVDEDNGIYHMGGMPITKRRSSAMRASESVMRRLRLMEAPYEYTYTTEIILTDLSGKPIHIYIDIGTAPNEKDSFVNISKEFNKMKSIPRYIGKDLPLRFESNSSSEVLLNKSSQEYKKEKMKMFPQKGTERSPAYASFPAKDPDVEVVITMRGGGKKIFSIPKSDFKKGSKDKYMDIDWERWEKELEDTNRKAMEHDPAEYGEQFLDKDGNIIDDEGNIYSGEQEHSSKPVITFNEVAANYGPYYILINELPKEYLNIYKDNLIDKFLLGKGIALDDSMAKDLFDKDLHDISDELKKQFPKAPLYFNKNMVSEGRMSLLNYITDRKMKVIKE